jgi:hypothetical protein
MRTVSSVALLLILVPFTNAATAQQQGRPTPWYGFAVECGDCERSVSADTTRRPLLISRVAPDSPARRGALQVGDTIFAANDKPVSPRELRALLASATPSSSVSFVVGTSRGRFTYKIRPSSAPKTAVGNDMLPVRYRGEFADVTLDVLTNASPVVTRDSAGAVLIRMGEHVIRLQRSR